MSKNNKYKIGPNDFLDYSEGKLTGRKRNAFERYLEQNLFDAEASEGFTMVSREEAEQDLAAAGRQIKRRIKRRKRIGWYSAAAALASILVISTIFFNVDRSTLDQNERIEELPKGFEQPAQKKTEKGRVNLQEGEKAKDENLAEDLEQSPGQAVRVAEDDIVIDQEEISDEAVSLDAVTMEAELVVPTKEETPAVLQTEDASPQVGAGAAAKRIEEEIVLDDFSFEADQGEPENEAFEMVMDDAELEEKSAMKASGAKRRDVVATETSRAAAAPVMMDESVILEEVVNVSAQATINSAKPIDGMVTYMEYLNSELVFPASETTVNTATVDISFYVLPGGRPYNIKIVSSPSQAFSDEVHRVVTNGPDWIPASTAGEYVDEEVKMKIEFREEHKR